MCDAKWRNALEQRRVKVVARDEDLDEDEERAERHGHEAVDERAVERRGLDEGTRGGTDDELLPQGVLGRRRHERVELRRGVRHRDLVVDDVEVDHVSGEELAEVKTVGLLQELWAGGTRQGLAHDFAVGKGRATCLDVGRVRRSVAE